MNKKAKIFLILLRIAIGWHFLYEGVTKLATPPWQKPFTSESYLQSSTGPFRGVLRSLIADRDGLARIKRESIESALDRRYEEIINHYQATGPLTDAQKTRLKSVVDDIKASMAERFDDPDYLQRLSDNAATLVDTDEQLLNASLDPAERARLQKARDDLRRTIAKAVGKPITLLDKQLTREELKVVVAQAAEESLFLKRVADYQQVLARVKEDESQLQAQYTRERLAADRAKLNKTREELLAIAAAPVVELDAVAQKLADADQMRAGPVPQRGSQTRLIDLLTAWGLTLVGLGLIVGLLTPVASVGAAAFLALFYLATPPWPGLPEPSIAEGHYLFVNKNLIELIAVLALAVTPTGEWFGLDRWAKRYFSGWSRGRLRSKEATPEPQASDAPDASKAGAGGTAAG